MKAWYTWDDDYLYLGYETFDKNLVALGTGEKKGPKDNQIEGAHISHPKEKVDVVEFLGNEFQLHLSSAGQTFVARVDTRTQTQPGASLRVGFDRSKLHVFDKESEEAIA